MTVMTALPGVTAPPLAAPAADAPGPHALAAAAPAPMPDDVGPAILPALTASRRADGWSAAAQTAFLAAIAEGAGVEAAAARVGLSAQSAYAFRRTARGAAFALGWRAATLVAREVVAETLMVRALHGQVDTYTRADGTAVTRHRHDNRLAMSLLARLDRQVEAAPDADVRAAALVAQEFDAFLAMVAADDAGPARAGLFLARRTLAAADDDAGDARDLAPLYALAAADRLVRTGHATAGEVPVADLDPHDRAGWTADQWQRAEAAGLIALAPPVPDPQESQHSPDDDDDDDEDADEARENAEAEIDAPVWWDESLDEWRTSFPPPVGFDGDAVGEPGLDGYDREVTGEEADALGPGPGTLTPQRLAAQGEARDAFFAWHRANGAAAADPADDADDPPARYAVRLSRCPSRLAAIRAGWVALAGRTDWT